MAFLAVRRVTYEGHSWSYESPPLANGLNVLEGENGTGKSTFANLIYYGLGGKVKSFHAEQSERHAEIANDSHNFVQLLITIDGIAYTLKRFIGTNDIAIDGDDVSAILPLNRRETAETFSDWLLSKLGISPVTISFGLYSGKIAITDFMRLIYHDQSPDPSGVFKAVDNDSFVTDSREFRAAIFEILIGKSYQEYYSALADYRDAERERAAIAKVVEQFEEMATQLQLGSEAMNTVFIKQRIKELLEQQKRLLSYRRELAKAPPPRTPGLDLGRLQKELLGLQVTISGLARREAGLLEESSRLEQLKGELVAEATQLRKMMFANEQLKLFSQNTCPYCLKDVARVPHKCVCGNDVVEGDYEKFFYDSAEYLAILKSRQKNVDTVSTAVQSVHEELRAARAEKAVADAATEQLELQIHQSVEDTDTQIDLRRFEETESSLAAVRDEIGKLRQEQEIVARGEALREQLNAAAITTESRRYRVQELSAAAQADMLNKRVAFSKIYDRMMRATLSDCKEASIDENYKPIVNGGQYTEASAGVPRRLLYFATLLEMSLTDDSVSFPRFLLIDTPETSGIDPSNLRAALSRIIEVIAKGKELGRECQVILTTGIGKYPNDAAVTLLGTMSKDGKRLLKAKQGN